MELSGRAGPAGLMRLIARTSWFLARRCSRAKPGPLQRVLAANVLTMMSCPKNLKNMLPPLPTLIDKL